MATLDPAQARTYMHKLLSAMKDAGGSDLFIAADFPPSIKANGQMSPLTRQKLPADITRQLAHAMMNDPQRADFVPVVAISLLLAFAATLYPSWRASRVQPADALRYE